MICTCGAQIKQEAARCSCGKRNIRTRSRQRCRWCGAPVERPADSCGKCEELREQVEDLLLACPGCPFHEERRGRQRCLKLDDPCTLTGKLLSGWRCPLGFHDAEADMNLVTVDPVEIVHRDAEWPRAVVTVATGDHWQECREVTRDRMAAYAAKVCADFVELDGDHCPEWPMANKFRVHEVASHYDRVLYLDCDIVIRECAPDLFKMVPPGLLGVFDELEATRAAGGGEWAQRQAAAVSVSQGLPPSELTWCANGGVILLPGRLRELYAPPERPIPAMWCADQQLLTVRANAAKTIPFFLDWRFNCLKNAPWFDSRSHSAYFLHANGTKSQERLTLLKRWNDG